MVFGTLLLSTLLINPSFASAPPPVLVLIVESIKKRSGEAAVTETYGPELEYKYQPASTSGESQSVSSGDAPQKALTPQEKMMENMRKQRERFQKNAQDQQERFEENTQKMIQRFNDNLAKMKSKYSNIYRSWEKKRPEFERDRKEFNRNLIDYEDQWKEEKERQKKEKLEQQKEERRLQKEKERLEALEKERKRREAEIRKQKEKEEQERILKEQERQRALEMERERQKQEALRRKQEEERRQEEALRREEERKRQAEIRKRKAEEEALRKKQEEEEARLRERQRQQAAEERERKRQEALRRKKSKNAISWRVVKGALEYPIRNQSGRGTCASFATVRAIELKANQRNYKVDLSEQFFYWASKPECQQSPCSTQGSWPLPGLNYGKERNIPTESQCPYSTKFVRKNDTQIPLAPRCKRQGPVGIVEYETGSEVSDIVGWIEQDHPVVIATKLSPNYYADEPWIDYRNRSKGSSVDDHSIGHAYLLVGYVKLPKNLHAEEGRYCFLAANSWGEGWGKGGHACISERWLATYRIPNPYIAVTKVRIDR